MAFWGLIGVGLTLEGIGIPLVAAFESGGWRIFGFVLVAAGIIALFSALAVRARAGGGAGGQTATAGRDAYAAGRDINISDVPSTRSGAKRRDVERTTPEQLMAFYDRNTSAQVDRLVEPYKGKWIRARGTVSDVWETSGGATLVMSLIDKEPGEMKQVLARFEKPSAASVSLLHKEEEVQVVGQFGSVGATNVELLKCELEDRDQP